MVSTPVFPCNRTSESTHFMTFTLTSWTTTYRSSSKTCLRQMLMCVSATNASNTTFNTTDSSMFDTTTENVATFDRTSPHVDGKVGTNSHIVILLAAVGGAVFIVFVVICVVISLRCRCVRGTRVYTVGQKRPTRFFVYIFAKCWPISNFFTVGFTKDFSRHIFTI